MVWRLVGSTHYPGGEICIALTCQEMWVPFQDLCIEGQEEGADVETMMCLPCRWNR
jgi:hypothetical protein